jgi:polyisoprenoid-binding protein YceI
VRNVNLYQPFKPFNRFASFKSLSGSKRSNCFSRSSAGFAATTTINRHHFGMEQRFRQSGVVVGNMVEITIDDEAILQEG